MKRCFEAVVALCLAFSLSACIGPGQDNPEAEKAAIAAADTWLERVDTEDYAQSWEQAAPFFKGKVDRDQWVDQVGGVRDPLGSVESRALESSAYRTSLPGAPDGEYVVIQYQTSFANKKNAVETVTPMKTEDGWRVSGYYVK